MIKRYAAAMAAFAIVWLPAVGARQASKADAESALRRETLKIEQKTGIDRFSQMLLKPHG